MELTFIALLAAIQIHSACATGSLTVNTTSGPVQGVLDESAHVAQFLGIPFAEPPIGSRRWLPPSAKSQEKTTIDASHFGFACPQYENDVNIAPNAYTVDVPQFSISPFDYQSEDCLSLSIWTPWMDNYGYKRETQQLPVIVWFYGGGFGQGGANIPYQNPAPWVSRSQKHIVVSVK